MSLIELLERFPDEESCRQHLIAMRWPEGVKCPRCECQRVSALPKRKQWTCLGCRYRFSATTGTIFHKSHIRLRKWFMAIFIVLNAKKGISSLQLNRELKISQECCWHMIHRIREAMRESRDNLFSGIIQVDEYYHGGRPRQPAIKPVRFVDERRTFVRDNIPVLGFYEAESGTVRTEVIADAKRETIQEAMTNDIDFPNAELHTDEMKSYTKIGRLCRAHRIVCHSERYVAPDGTHTNNIENAWSLFNRAVVGSFHKISTKHLHRYLSEFDSRFNSRRQSSTAFFNRILQQSEGRRLSRRCLVGSSTSLASR